MLRNGGDLAGQTVLRYQEIIDGVAGRVKPEFATEGIDESVLDELRALWEAKLVATGVVGEPSSEGQQFIQQQQPLARSAGVPMLSITVQQHHHLQQPHQYVAVRPPFQPGLPGAAIPMGVPQQMMVPGAPQQQVIALLQAQAHARQAALVAEQKRKLDAAAAAGAPDPKVQRIIPQQDGPADDDGGGGEEAAGAEDAPAGARGDEAQQKEEDDDPLTEDDEGSGDEVDEAAVSNVVLGQFEKVQRSKSKWKVVLKDCILTLNGRDYLVRRCTGDMDF